MLLTLAPRMGYAQGEDRIVTVGDDLTEAQQTEVLRLLGASPDDRIIRVTTPETVRASRGIIEIPPGTPSISSTAITCRPKGSGIDVQVQNIEEVTAGMYAQSLLTAGITDADLRVAAPADAPAEGLTALTGIFKAYRLSPCTGGRLDPARERLAQRELATTVDLGEAIGDREAASEVVLNTQEQVVSRKLRSRAEIEQVVTQQLRSRGGADVPAAARNQVVDLMTDLGSPDVDWGGYSQGWDVRRQNRNQVSIKARPSGAGADAGDRIRATVNTVTGNRLAVTGPNGAETITAGNNVEVIRNGNPATVRQIQPDDTVVVERDAEGNATRIVATSAGGANRGAAGRTFTGNVATAGAGALSVLTASGTENVRTANARNVDVLRNGRDATVAQIQPGDQVTRWPSRSTRTTCPPASSRRAGVRRRVPYRCSPSCHSSCSCATTTSSPPSTSARPSAANHRRAGKVRGVMQFWSASPL
jgi:uncharacterized protein YpuA (DUF1002 family)